MRAFVLGHAGLCVCAWGPPACSARRTTRRAELHEAPSWPMNVWHCMHPQYPSCRWMKIREDPDEVVQRGIRLWVCDMQQPMERRQGARGSRPLWSRTAGWRGHGGHTSWSPASAREVRLSVRGQEDRHAHLAAPSKRQTGGLGKGGGSSPSCRGCAPCLIPLVALAGQRAFSLLAACYLAPHARVLRWPSGGIQPWIGGR